MKTCISPTKCGQSLKKQIRTLCLGIFLSFPVFTIAQELAQNAPVVSPELAAGNAVTFRIKAPGASEVKLSGNWMPVAPDGNGGFAQQMASLEKGEDGVWSVAIPSMAPELYSYAFMVDGVRTLDPANKHILRDGRFSTRVVRSRPGFRPVLGPGRPQRQRARSLV